MQLAARALTLPLLFSLLLLLPLGLALGAYRRESPLVRPLATRVGKGAARLPP